VPKFETATERNHESIVMPRHSSSRSPEVSTWELSHAHASESRSDSDGSLADDGSPPLETDGDSRMVRASLLRCCSIRMRAN
jgi:hypothetical protein